jgi:hypothetical protein
MSEKRLQGLRVAVLAVDGFEQVEVTIPMRAQEIDPAGTHPDRMVKGLPPTTELAREPFQEGPDARH